MVRMKPEIVIRADGSKSIGMGHIRPMLTLAHELRRLGHSITFLTSRDPLAIPVLLQNRFDISAINSPADLEGTRLAISQLNPALIIVNTWENESDRYFQALHHTGVKILGFYQKGRGLKYCDEVINPLPSAFLSPRRRKIFGAYFEGPDYIILSEAAAKLAAKKRPIKPNIKVITVAIGGTDPGDVSETIKNMIRRYSDRITTFVSRGQLTQNDFLKQVSSSDLVITGGGNTLFEAASFGVPTLAIANEPWEKKTIKYAQKKGCTIYLGTRHEVASNDFERKLIRNLESLDLQRREKMSRAGTKLVDGKGLSRAVKIIESML